MNHFLFVSAENDALDNCKAGGMGDVVRDVPREIAERGDKVHVVVPAYSRLQHNGRLIRKLEFILYGRPFSADLFEVVPKRKVHHIRHYVIHHPDIRAGEIGKIYHHDPEKPFFTDSNKFALFCTALAAAIRDKAFGKLDVVHLHDWHTSLLLFLRAYHPSCIHLKKYRIVYSIHNLSIQGIRPFEGNEASVNAWFPEITYPREPLMDNRYRDCINLMAVGVRLADAVHTVSPSYREEILLPSRPPEFIGGESLENDLKEADKQGRLFGILNGCNYRNIRTAEPDLLFMTAVKAIFGWLQEEAKKYKADFLAHTGEKLLPFLSTRPGFICSSVARLTEQKFYFFKHSPEALLSILRKLEKVNGIYMVLGTGAPEYEELFRKISREHSNFIFFNGQSEDVIDSIYLETDLYFMPSQFEPCGISQMLAMRNGHPCLVHSTGGLKDTVSHLETGFAFDGETYEEKIANMLKCFDEALDVYQNEPKKWNAMREKARKKRFTWKKSVDAYYKKLYGIRR